MRELPEASVVAAQAQATVAGRTIVSAIAGASPHGFAWYSGEPASYAVRLAQDAIDQVENAGNFVLFRLASGSRLFFAEGAMVRWHRTVAEAPKKHQFLADLDDGSALAATIQMYGFIGLEEPGAEPNPYLRNAQQSPNWLEGGIGADAFVGLARGLPANTPAKAFLATDQRFPGVGNGVIQDVLFLSGIHPRSRLGALEDDALRRLHGQLLDSLAEMRAAGGRDVERDFFGNPGGYRTLMSRNTEGCPRGRGVLLPILPSGARLVWIGGQFAPKPAWPL